MNNTNENRLRAYQIAKTIFEQIKAAGVNIMWSWGARRFQSTYYKNMPALKFWVSGFIHKGWVVVAYNEGADTYEGFLLNRLGRETKSLGELYCDNFVDVIDRAVETENAHSTEYTSNVKSFICSL